jgi:hypothetical protein
LGFEAERPQQRVVSVGQSVAGVDEAGKPRHLGHADGALQIGEAKVVAGHHELGRSVDDALTVIPERASEAGEAHRRRSRSSRPRRW